MTSPEVHESEHHYEPVTGHDDFADNLPLGTAEVGEPPIHNEVRAARLAGLEALKNSGVIRIRPDQIQQIQSEAMIAVRTDKAN